MNEAIIAIMVETPKPVWPRLYVAVLPKREGREWYGTSDAWLTIAKARERPTEPLAIFALPGSEEVWSEERLREAAVRLCGEAHYDDCMVDILVEWSRRLGVLPGTAT